MPRLVALVCVVGAIALVGCATRWRETRPQKGQCVIALPESIEESGYGLDTSLGHLVFGGKMAPREGMLRWLSPVRPRYFVLYADVSRFTATQRETLARELRDAWIKTGAKIERAKLTVEERPYSTEGCHGIAVEMRSARMLTLVRICVSEQRLYILDATAYKEKDNPRFADRFFDSFRIENPTPRPSP